MSPPYEIELMTSSDLDEVLSIERASFLFPWSGRAFLSELASPHAVYRVVRLGGTSAGGVAKQTRPSRTWWPGRKRSRPAPPKGPIVAYGGLQMVLDEGHIMTLAVHPDYRRRGIGELVLLTLLEEAQRRGAVRLTLEVRVSNLPAQALYLKYGFSVAGHRVRYYGDGEDALIMWTDRLDAAANRIHLEKLRRQLGQRLEQVCDSDPGSGNIL